MRIIEPNQPKPDTLTSSSVAESSVALWDDATAYTKGDKVRRWTDGAYRLFEARQDSTGEDPAGNPVDEDGGRYWRSRGPTDRWAMFSGSVSAPTVQDDGAPLVVEYTPGPGRRVNALALFNVDCTDVTLEVTSEIGDGVVYSETVSGTGARGPGWWQFLFGEVQRRTRFNFFGIPPYPDAVFTITATPVGGKAAIGEAVFGQNFTLGTDEIGMQPRIKDYSINEFDADFGYNTLVRRQTRRQLMIDVVIPSERADIVFNRMEKLASKRVVWIADKFETGSLYGFYKEFTPTHSTHPLVYASLKIEGLV